MFFSIIFGLAYILVIGGGDTLAYWEASSVMHNMFFNSPSLYFEQIFSPPNWDNYYSYFNHYVGYPPGFIYREPESYFVSKVITLLSFATFKSYIATNLIIAFLSAKASWKLFKYMLQKEIFNKKILAIGILFLPSVAFWCSGVSKDAIVYISSIFLITNLWKLLDKNMSLNFLSILSILLNAFLIYHIRDFILYLIILVFVTARLLNLLKTKKDEHIFNMIKRTISISTLVIGLGVIIFNFTNKNLAQQNDILKEASIVQEDFTRNKSYGSNRYSLGEVDYTLFGLVKVFPVATIIGIYEPFIWNARSALLIPSGFESIYFIALTYMFMRKSLRKKIRYIRSQEFLLFTAMFFILLGFMAGFSSILYGVLVRIKAPLLPFLMIILAIDWKPILGIGKSEEEQIITIND